MSEILSIEAKIIHAALDEDESELEGLVDSLNKSEQKHLFDACKLIEDVVRVCRGRGCSL